MTESWKNVSGVLESPGKVLEFSPQWTNCSYNYDRMHYACAKRPYFHFQSKTWRHHRVPWPRFSKRRRNFGDSCSFKTDV